MLSYVCFLLILQSTCSLVSSSQNSTTVHYSIEPQQIDPAITISQFVTAHNRARRKVGVPPLVWDPKLARFARGYANERRQDCLLVHSPGYAYGENIFWGQGRRWTANAVVASWVAEGQWYHHDSNSCSGHDCSHYTQIVWRITERVGCGKIVCDSGDTFVACEYYPPGNYMGARPYLGKHTSP